MLTSGFEGLRCGGTRGTRSDRSNPCPQGPAGLARDSDLEPTSKFPTAWLQLLHETGLPSDALLKVTNFNF